MTRCTTALLISIVTLVSCQNDSLPTGGSDVQPLPDFPTAAPASNPADVPIAPGVAAESPTQCETIGITARRVLSVSPGQVVLRVNASYNGPGTPYTRIIDAPTGRSLGDYPLGDITLSLPAGDYHVYIFVEVKLDGRVIQCDGSLRFTIPTLPPPPPPGGCEGDGCDPEPPCTDDCGPPPPPPCPEFATNGCEPPPPPLPDCLCHVQLQEHNNRWNEQQKCHGERAGHINEHFDRPYPDYWGACDGRYQ